MVVNLIARIPAVHTNGEALTEQAYLAITAALATIGVDVLEVLSERTKAGV